MATTVTYKGSTIATVNNGTKTLKTAGTMMEDDVTLVDVSGSSSVLVQKTITENGTYDPADDNADGYSEVIVNVSGGGGTTWETLHDGNLWITSSSPNYVLFNNYTTPFLEDETYRVTWGSDTFIYETASDGGRSYDGYYIGNPGVVGGTDDGSGATFFIYRDRADRAVGATTDASGSKYVKIEKQVSSGGGNYQAKTGITPTTSSQTITADSGYDALSSVQINAMPTGTAGTPTATKGSVSNHAVSVTPSVTNSAGYVPSETKTGTAVTVSASELVSGSETKTANGTYDVTNLAELIVNVSGGASNVVTGTFKGTTTGSAMDVTLNYTGSGYPIAVLIYPAEGPYNSGSGSFYSTVQRYAAAFYALAKSEMGTTPTYESSGTNNTAVILHRYKSSASNATTYSQTSSTSNMYRDASAGTGGTQGAGIVKVKSKTKLSVYIASTSYGFMANIDYKYWVIYSS